MRILLLLALGFTVACTGGRSEDPTDPVSQLLSRSYLKSMDDFGSHHISSVLQVEGSGPDGVSTQTIYEEVFVDARSNYRVLRREHEGAVPWELVCIGSSYFVVSPDGSIEPLQPGMLGQTTRERAAESWRTVMEPFRSGIVLTKTGDGNVGRPVDSYVIELAQNAKATPDGIKPQSLSGKAKIDQATGFPLFVEVRGSYTHSPVDKPEVALKIKKFTFAIDQFGQVKDVENPTLRKKKPKRKTKK